MWFAIKYITSKHVYVCMFPYTFKKKWNETNEMGDWTMEITERNLKAHKNDKNKKALQN